MKRPLHILIIDDDADDAGFLAGAFTGRLPGTLITHCKNGQEGIDYLNHTAGEGDYPNAAFLDLHMPGLTGYAVLGLIRASKVAQDLPVIVISTSLLESEARKCREAGCSGYFTKPYSIEEYDDIVAATLTMLEWEARP